MGKLKSYQEQFQHVLEKGINTTEQRHKRLVTRPFDFAEKVEKEAKSYSFKSVRQAHNHYAKEVYASLRSLNERANGFASNLISRLEKETPNSAEEAKAEASAAVEKASAKANSARKSAPAKKAANNGASTQSNTASA